MRSRVGQTGETDATGDRAVSDAARSVLVLHRPDSADSTVEATLFDREPADIEVADPTETDVGERIAAADVVVADGEAALLSLAGHPPDCPVVPVGTGATRYDVPATDVAAAVDAVGAGVETAPHPVLGVTIDGETVGHAVTDVSLVTAEPARISEYGVASGAGWSDTVRADGIVVATPLGSEGYAHAVGGPLLAPETGLAAVPISPYAMHADVWVLRPPVSVSVERDEAAVSLLLDDEEARTVPAKAPVEITVSRTLAVVTPDSVPDR
ncbi:NAD+ kinase [Halobellus clavatus]|uniref:NAD+ kinase n=1 Tax=Halobellus clavatus TaxID=660517 RepID=A0A1H3CN14_9EURY|nr:NAD+ kinase [Halobellus clavatus]